MTYDDWAPPGLSHEEWMEAQRRVKLFRSWDELGASTRNRWSAKRALRRF